MEKTLQGRIAKKVFVNPIYRDRATVLSTSEDTGGKYLLGQLEVAPGGGNQLHTHSRFEETFIAVEGKLGVRYGDKKLYLKPGESITIPIGKPHHFFNDGKRTITCQVKLTPAHDGFIKGIAIAYGLAADGLANKKGIPKSLLHLALIIQLTDTIATGPMRWAMPLFKVLAKRAKRKGIEQQLLDKYYYE